jgi:hypothetical protein
VSRDSADDKAGDIVSAACIEAINRPGYRANKLVNTDTLRELIAQALRERQFLTDAELYDLWPKFSGRFHLANVKELDKHLKARIVSGVDWRRFKCSERDGAIYLRWLEGATIEKAGSPLSRERSKQIIDKMERLGMRRVREAVQEYYYALRDNRQNDNPVNAAD